MRDWIEGLVGPEYAVLTIVLAGAVVALFVLWLILRLLRGKGDGTYVAGGRNRKARLAVMDATAIDNYRRLVLVRRDDVEHLILIGGSADVVVESNIRLAGAQAQRPIAVAEPVYDQPQPEPEPVRAPPPVTMRPAPPPRSAPAPAPRPQPTRIEPRPSFSSSPAATPPRTVAPVAPPAPASKQRIDAAFDDDLLRELEVELDTDARATRAARPAPSLDDEMSRLLDEFTVEKR